MARIKKHRQNNVRMNSVRRNISNIANHRLYHPKNSIQTPNVYVRKLKRQPRKTLYNLEDRRLFTPQNIIKSHRSLLHTLAVNTNNRIAFTQPKQILLCVKRKTRREVLLALGRGGKNSRPKFNNQSKISCKE